MLNESSPWSPNKEDRKTMQLMFDIGKTYNEFYFFNYGKDLGLMLERLSLTLLKISNKLELDYKDKNNYLKLRDKMKGKLVEILKPRFEPGELAIFQRGEPCTVVSPPYVDNLSRKIVVDVLMEGTILKAQSHKLKKLERKKKINSPEVSSPESEQ